MFCCDISSFPNYYGSRVNLKLMAKSCAARLISKSNSMEVPVNVEALARMQGIKEIRQTEMSVDAMLLSTSDGLIVNVNQNICRERQRFSLAHEIAHTFFLSKCESSQASKPHYRLGNMNATDIEKLCDIAAAHMIMPDPIFKCSLKEYGISIESILRLSSSFQTSIQSTAMRVAEASPEECVIAFCEVADKPGDAPKLRISWSAQSENQEGGKNYFIPRLKAVEPTSAVGRAYESHMTIKGFEKIELGNLNGYFYTEAKAFGADGNRYVLFMIFPNRQICRGLL